jgi:hypothetical protein
MGLLIVRHKVMDYSKWRPLFDGHAEPQRSAGLTNPRVFRSAEDPNELVVIFDMNDTKAAKEFAASPRLHEAMREGGVIDSPTILFLDPA